ncbi:hypothetical protein TARUN_7623 [Trichoderma arundinaceum]|uniref:Uncharacterized protein n=1 Tax=Trichoderma arundinaceum TaxID=490622 RepID=A0A395NF76_TRIAR|nr:hypothetical protein TARUN_7623 [Trichoderma arundinaceum]
MPVAEDPETGAAVPPVPPQVSPQETTLETTINAEAYVQNQQTEEETGEVATSKLVPSSQFTGHQLFYIFGLDGIGALALSGGVNFAIAYGKQYPVSLALNTYIANHNRAAMYTTQDTVKRPIRLWQLPNTLAGDAAVTIIVQCIITWFVELFILRYDLRQHSVQPIGFIPQPIHPWLRLFFFLPRDSTAEPRKEPRPWSFLELIQQALRGFSFAVVSFLLLWPIFMGVLTAFGRKEGADYVYHDKWLPQVFKLILGGVLGLLTTPLMAMFWLVKAGWEYEKSPLTAAEV